ANKFMQQAVTTRPDAIVTVGLSSTETGSGMAAAQGARIPVGCVACWDESAPDNSNGVYAATSPTPSVFSAMGYADAATGQPAFQRCRIADCDHPDSCAA